MVDQTLGSFRVFPDQIISTVIYQLRDKMTETEVQAMEAPVLSEQVCQYPGV